MPQEPRLSAITVGLTLKSFIFILPILILSCTNDYPGTYSACCGENPTKEGCHYIVLNKDGSFLYSNPFTISGNQETKGVWTFEEDSIVLNNDLHRFSIRTSKSKVNSSDSLILRVQHEFKNHYSDCSFATVFTSSTDSFNTNHKGIVSLARKSLDSLRIKYIGCSNEWILLGDSISGGDSLLITCNTEALGQIEMDNLKWRIINDTLFIVYDKTAIEKLVKRGN